MLRAAPLLPLLLTPPPQPVARTRSPFARIRVVCSDMDGTLLSPSYAPSARTLDAVRGVMAAGITFCVCTGRARAGALDVLGPLGDELRSAPGVFIQGQQVFGADENLLYDVCLPKEVRPGPPQPTSALPVATLGARGRQVILRTAAFAERRGVSLVGCAGECVLMRAEMAHREPARTRNYCAARVGSFCVCARTDERTDSLASIGDPLPTAEGEWEEMVRAISARSRRDLGARAHAGSVAAAGAHDKAQQAPADGASR